MSLIHLDSIIVGDNVDAWRAAGFSLSGRTVTVGAVTVDCAGDDRLPAWRVWSDDASLPADIDGIPTETIDAATDPSHVVHPNRVVGIDHIVLRSPDLGRTTEAFADLGVECRRIREIPGSEPAMQQRFFRFGPVILELVGMVERTGDGPASIWGFAFDVDDIDAAVAHLGPACGQPKDAVQPGRRIVTVRTRDLGISLPIALMSPSPPR